MAARAALSLLLFAAVSAVQEDVYFPAETSYERYLASGDIALSLGAPYFGSVEAESYAYYLVEVPTTFTELFLVLTPQFGNVNLLASTTHAGRPHMGKAQYASKFSVGSEFIRIYPSDPAVLAACPHTSRVGSICRFSVGVYGGTASSYVITASTSGIVKGLTPDLPLEDTSSPNTYVTYAFRAATPDVTFTLTTYSGAPALYLAHPNAESPRPRGDVLESYCKKSAPVHPDGASTSISYGVLTVQANDPCACETYPCTYTIGVGSTDHTSYSIAASDGALGGGVVKLMDGIPLRARGPATAGEPLYFEYSFIPDVVQAKSSAILLTVTLSQHVGSSNAMLYALWNSGESYYVVPSVEEHDYAARVATGIATFTVRTTDASFANSCGVDTSYICTIKLAVIGAADALYTVVTNTDAGVQLSDGLPMAGEVAAHTAEIAYFRYRHVFALAPLVFAVTPLSGTVDIFISCVAVADTTGYLPNEARHQWKYIAPTPSVQGSLVSMSIRPDAPGACAAPATYYIGVRAGVGSDGLTSFSVLARTRGESTVALFDGQPANDLLVGGIDSLPSSTTGNGEYALYSYTFAPTDTSVSLTLNSVKGNVAMYVTVNGTIPTNKMYQYSLPLSSSKDLRKDRSILLTRNDPLVKEACSSSITRNVTTSHVEFTCVVPINATEEVCGYRTVYTHELVTEDLGPRVCTINIAVNSDLNGAAYSITASSFYKYLRDGVTAEIDIPIGGTTYLIYEASHGATHSQLVLSPVFGRAVAYISTSEQIPNEANAQYTFGGVHANVLSLDASMAACVSSRMTRCLHYIAIQSFGNGVTRVRVTGNSMSTISLDLNTPVSGHAFPDQLTYYSFALPTSLSQLQLDHGIAIVIEAMSSSGWILALLSHTTDPATKAVLAPTLSCANPAYTLLTCPAKDKVSANVDISVQGLPSRTRISIPPGSPALRPGASFVLGVVSHVPTDFVVSVKPAGEATALANGITTYDLFDSAQAAPIQYKVVLPQLAIRTASFEPILIQATPFEGYMTLYLGVNKPNPTPGMRGVTYDDMAGFAESYRFVVYPQYLENKCPNTDDCVLYISAHPAEFTSFPVHFGIVTNAGTKATETPTLLIPGVAQLSSATSSQYTYFYAPISNNGESFFVALEEVSGDAVMYINTDGTLPSASSHAVHVEGALVPELVVIRPDHPAYIYDGVLTIAVKGHTTLSQFYITIGTADTVMNLPDGAPLLGSAEAGKYTYYALEAPGAPGGDTSFVVVPLSGQVEVYGSVWYTGASSQFEKSAFRPKRETGHHTFSGNFEGTLIVPSSHSDACTGPCTYIFAVYCASRGTADCHFEVSGAASELSLERLVEGVPGSGELQEGQTKYYVLNGGHDHAEFTFSGHETNGAIVMMLSESFVPGEFNFADLPKINVPTSYSHITAEGNPVLKFNQYGDTFLDPASSAVIRDSVYVLAVHAVIAPVSFSVVVSRKGGASILMPGFPTSNNWMAPRQTHYYMFDQQDLTSDLLIIVTALYGDLAVNVSPRGQNVPTCTFSIPQVNVRPSVACGNSVWEVSSTPGSTGSLVLRIRTADPCANAMPSAKCNAAVDWRSGNYWISVSSFTTSLYSITAASSYDPVRVLDGSPSHYVSKQALDAYPSSYTATPVLLYQTRPEDSTPDIRITLAADNLHASYTYYLTSCQHNKCTEMDRIPSAENHILTGYGQAGARMDLVLSKGTPAYCIGDGMHGDLCNYYMTLVPDVQDCLAKDLTVCAADINVTFLTTNGNAPIKVDFMAVDGRIVTIPGTLNVDSYGNVAKMPNYYFYINREDYSGVTYTDVIFRLDSCDALRGHPIGYVCASSPNANGDHCAYPQRPGPAASDHMYTLSTSSKGLDRLSLLNEPSNEVYISVGNNPLPVNRTGATDYAMTKYGPSTYELQIIDGQAVRMNLPEDPAPITVTRVSNTVANLTWAPAVVAAHAGSDALTLPAVGVKYTVYYTLESFTNYASTILKSNASDIGIMPATPCGLERWANLVADAFTPEEVPVNSPPTVLLDNLSAGKRYRVNVVAYCDVDCLNANYLQLGLPLPGGSFSTQRISYTSTYFVLTPEGGNEEVSEPISTSIYGFGIVCMIALVAVSVYLGFRKQPASAAPTKPKAKTQASNASPGVLIGADGRPIQINPNSHFYSSRKLRSSVPSGLSATTGLPEASMSVARIKSVAVEVPEEANTISEMEQFQQISNKLLQSAQSSSIDMTSIEIGPEHDIFNGKAKN